MVWTDVFTHLLLSNLTRASVGGSLHSGMKIIKDNGSIVSDNKFYNKAGIKLYKGVICKFCQIH